MVWWVDTETGISDPREVTSFPTPGVPDTSLANGSPGHGGGPPRWRGLPASNVPFPLQYCHVAMVNAQLKATHAALLNLFLTYCCRYSIGNHGSRPWRHHNGDGSWFFSCGFQYKTIIILGAPHLKPHRHTLMPCNIFFRGSINRISNLCRINLKLQTKSVSHLPRTQVPNKEQTGQYRIGLVMVTKQHLETVAGKLIFV